MEEWRNIAGFEGIYMVSNLGRVKNVKRDSILSPGRNSKGYLRVILCNNGTKKQVLVHRLVALAFIPNPDGKREVNHIDCNKQNNAVSNLEWVTHSENMRHMHDAAKIGADTVAMIKECIAEAKIDEERRRAKVELRMIEIEEKARRLGVVL